MASSVILVLKVMKYFGQGELNLPYSPMMASNSLQRDREMWSVAWWCNTYFPPFWGVYRYRCNFMIKFI